MDAAEQRKFLEVLGGVHDFYGRDLSKFSVAVWLQACEGFDVEQVTKALSAHLMDPERGQFMPKPADIVRQLQGTATDRSLLAWGKVLDACNRVGGYKSVVFDEPAIHAALRDMGGWVEICRGSIDDLPFLQKRFCDGYRAYVKRADFDYPKVLIGTFEANNMALGYASAEPVLIGNQVAARRVMAQKRGLLA